MFLSDFSALLSYKSAVVLTSFLTLQFDQQKSHALHAKEKSFPHVFTSKVFSSLVLCYLQALILFPLGSANY